MHVVNMCGFIAWFYDSDSSENDSKEGRLERWPYSAIVIEGDSIEGMYIDIRGKGLETAHVRHTFQRNVERTILAVANW